jgi:ribosomal protein S18 acetylase RimI-like enzyme
MVPFSIRLGQAADSSALAELAARTFREAFGADNRPQDLALHLAQAYGPAVQARELADPGVTTLVVEVEGHLAGYAQLRAGPVPPGVTGPAPLELWRFYIGGRWHGKGMAQALMERVVEEAGRREARTLWLGVWERNERAKAFYRKCGFEDQGSQIFLVGTDPQTDRIMVRPVAQAERK